MHSFCRRKVPPRRYTTLWILVFRCSHKAMKADSWLWPVYFFGPQNTAYRLLEIGFDVYAVHSCYFASSYGYRRRINAINQPFVILCVRPTIISVTFYSRLYDLALGLFQSPLSTTDRCTRSLGVWFFALHGRTTLSLRGFTEFHTLHCTASTVQLQNKWITKVLF